MEHLKSKIAIKEWEKLCLRSESKKTVTFKRQQLYHELALIRSAMAGYNSKIKYVWGMDLSLSHSGLAIFDIDDNSFELDCFATAPGPLPQRSMAICDWVEGWFHSRPPAMIIKETAFFNRKRPSSITLISMGLVAEQRLCSLGVGLYRGVTPTLIKSYTAGDGRGSKSDIADAMFKRWQIVCNSDDESDAIAMASIGLDLINVAEQMDYGAYSIDDKKSMREFEKDFDLKVGSAVTADTLKKIIRTANNGLSSFNSLMIKPEPHTQLIQGPEYRHFVPLRARADIVFQQMRSIGSNSEVI